MEKELEEWLKLHKFYMGDYRTIDLANHLKVNPRTIQRWVKEKSKPNTEQLTQIKRYMDAQRRKPEESI